MASPWLPTVPAPTRTTPLEEWLRILGEANLAIDAFVWEDSWQAPAYIRWRTPKDRDMPLREAARIDYGRNNVAVSNLVVRGWRRSLPNYIGRAACDPRVVVVGSEAGAARRPPFWSNRRDQLEWNWRGAVVSLQTRKLEIPWYVP